MLATVPYFKRHTLKPLGNSAGNMNNVLQVGLEQGDSKPFWRYVLAHRKGFSGVTPLFQKGKLITDRLKWAKILNNQFVSVFIKENNSDMSNLHGSDFPDLHELFISRDGVEKLLSGIQASKDLGPDLIPCLFLKELAHKFWLSYLNNPYRTESSHPTGKMLMWLLSSKRVSEIWQRTPARFL